MCWHFYCIHDGVEVDNKVLQLIECHVCYPNQITITNSTTQLRKGIISYFLNNGITTLEKCGCWSCYACKEVWKITKQVC